MNSQLSSASFDSPLRRTIAFLLAGGPLEAGKLQLMTYLCDLEHFWRHGHTLTGSAWMAREYGPVSPGLDSSLVVLSYDEIKFDPPLSVRQGSPDDDIVIDPIVPAQTVCTLRTAADANALGDDEQETARFIMQLTAPLKLEQVLRLAFNTSPMLVAASHAPKGKAKWGELINFNKRMASEAVALRNGAASTPEQAAFKLGELARIADLQQQALDAAR